MNSTIFNYHVTIQKNHLDSFGHVNNAMYMTLYEEARWEILNKNGYDLKKIIATQLGPAILEVKMAFLKEIVANDEIEIISQLLSYQGKIGVISQKMLRGSEVCNTADFTFGLFDLKARKLVSPTPEWLHAIGTAESS